MNLWSNKWRAGLLIVAALLLAGCNPMEAWSLHGHQSSVNPFGPVAQKQYETFLVTLWVSLAIFAVVGGMFLYCLLKFRVNEEDIPKDAPIPEQGHGNPLLEIGMIFVSVLLVAIILVPAIAGQMYSGTVPPDTKRVLVKVTGYQWWWKFEYPELGVVTANECALPVGVPVEFHVQTADVLHSFWVPALGGKMDLNPGQDNWLWLQADQPGDYWGQCTEFCGKSHAFMRFRAEGLTQADFDLWVANQKADVKEKAPAELLQNQCGVCHSLRGVPGAQGQVGPDLTHVGSRHAIMAGVRENSEENIKDWIQRPEYHKPGNVMWKAGYQAMKIEITDNEATTLAKYLYSLK